MAAAFVIHRRSSGAGHVLFSTRASAVLPTKLVEQAESFIRKRDYTGLSILCKNGDSCYARVMLTVANFMLRNPSAQFEEVREIASAEGGRQAGFLSRQISWLSDIGAVAPCWVCWEPWSG